MKVVIAGYATEGRVNFEYYKQLGHDVAIADERDSLDDVPEGVETILGSGAFSRLHGFDLVIRTAGLAPRKIKTDGKIWSATNEFFSRCPAPIVGVTGTKGKGTTCSLIEGILKAAGKTVHLVGNIGRPGLSVLDQIQSSDIVVYELSSFQLWDLEKSPHIAAVLPIEPDHMDVHADFDEYVAAKANIAAHQQSEDAIIYYSKNQYSIKIAEKSVASSRFAYPYQLEDRFIQALRLPGVHNQDNACAAILAAKAAVPDLTSADIEVGLSSFYGLPHRLKFVNEINGVKYYDDSISTTPGSAIAAIKSFDSPLVMIMGGSYKGADFSELADLMKVSKIKTVLLIGQEADRISKELSVRSVPFINLGEHVSMNEVVRRAAGEAAPGDIVILSPAAASFGMFKNYSDRGDQFIAAARDLSAV